MISLYANHSVTKSWIRLKSRGSLSCGLSKDFLKIENLYEENHTKLSM